MKWQQPTEKEWLVVANNEQEQDGLFYYAVLTTGIFCRPSCGSRLPKRENVVIFSTQEEALEAGFRPCKRCITAGMKVPDNEWVDQIKSFIADHYRETLTLSDIANHCHGSPFHLHHVFKAVIGSTPLEYLHRIRIARAREQLVNTDLKIAEIATYVGIDSPAQFSIFFKKYIGVSPKDYRKRKQVKG
ncbi:bifunctional transcriptional activator/DNA repair enzyme AdaA [Listeria sp. PSOL-1]|uniref:bifunctional transcriptional activator/DNA repair enzyme AdaA n=1 Tax=Listeria sp. PSOL-1 TaxID=1844999 RepID=UPI0013D4F927|nr:bifunctional transcriptional activator/DNA repair enzyme AdaA [Listeria sp. PSOL-1]